MKLTSDMINEKAMDLISNNSDWGIMGENGELFAYYVTGIIEMAESLKKELNKTTDGKML